MIPFERMRSSTSVPKTIDLYEHFPIRSHHYGKTHLWHHFLEEKKIERIMLAIHSHFSTHLFYWLKFIWVPPNLYATHIIW